MKKYVNISTWILILACWLGTNSANAQAPGYQGRTFIVKFDPLAPIYQKGIIAGFDWVVSRHFAFATSYNRAQRSHTQELANYKQTFGVFPKEKGTISEHQMGVEIQFYPDRSIPAPKGAYIFANYYQGIATATGHTFNPRNGGTLEPYTIDNIRSSTMGIGFGNKAIAWDRMILEFDFGIVGGLLNIPEDVPEDVKISFQSFTDQYGPNLYSFGEWFDNGGMGFSAHLKIGFLLF